MPAGSPVTWPQPARPLRRRRRTPGGQRRAPDQRRERRRRGPGEPGTRRAVRGGEARPGADRPARFLVTALATGVALLALWQVFDPLSQGSKYYLIFFLAGVLPLVFLAYPAGLRPPPAAAAAAARAGRPGRRAGAGARPTVLDWVLAAAALVVCLYPVLPFTIGSVGGGYNAFLDRQGLLVPLDVAMGTVLLLLLLEACRRTTGWVLPAVCLVFLGYGYYGGLLPQTWHVAHAGLDFEQLIDAFYNSDSGFYGTPLDVAATYIVLFTIYGAVLELSGAGRFFVELSVAAFRRSRTAAGRTAVASGLPARHGLRSGAATTVSIGAVTWPILRRAGYPAGRAGGMLAAAGVGAILSPPTLGAAAFIIAEYLGVSYLQVLGWATVRRSSTTWASCSPWRSTPGASAPGRWYRRRLAAGGCCPASATTSLSLLGSSCSWRCGGPRCGRLSSPPCWPPRCPSWTGGTG